MAKNSTKMEWKGPETRLVCMNEEKCDEACWVRHLAHLGGEEGGAEPRLAGAQHCAAAGIWSLLSAIPWIL